MFVALSSLARRAAWRAMGSPGLGARSAMSVLVRAWRRGTLHDYVEYPDAYRKVAAGLAFWLLPIRGKRKTPARMPAGVCPITSPDRQGQYGRVLVTA